MIPCHRPVRGGAGFLPAEYRTPSLLETAGAELIGPGVLW